jgi:hypothetical protein
VYRTCVGDHRLGSLQRLRCLRGVVDHHAMAAYRAALAGAAATISSSSSSKGTGTSFAVLRSRSPPQWEVMRLYAY